MINNVLRLKKIGLMAAVLSSVSFLGFSETEPLLAQSDEVYEENILFDSLDSSELLLNPETSSNLLSRSEEQMHSQPQLPINMTESQNSWVPRFVWVGDVQNSERLKCFAAFLIGSLNGEQQQKEAPAFNPGIIMTPNATASLNEDYLSSNSHTTKTKHVEKLPKQYSSPKPPSKRMSLDFQVAIPLLMFDKYQGNLVLHPTTLFPSVGLAGANQPVKGHPRYSIVPMFEMDVTFNILKWLGVGVYGQSQQGVNFRTKCINSVADTFNYPVYIDFESQVNFLAGGGRVVFNFPNFFKFKTWCLGFFASGGVGVASQTWTENKSNTQLSITATDTTNLGWTWATRYDVNLGYNADACLSIKSRNPFSTTLLKVGCKFIGWGQTTGLGQPSHLRGNIGYWKPITIRGIYSVAPYVGFNWNF